MSDIQETIEKLREFDRAASPAPWAPQGGFISCGQTSLDITYDKQDFPFMRLWARTADGDREVNPQDDFALIIEARNALPDLLAEIDRLTAENKKLKRENSKPSTELTWASFAHNTNADPC